MTVLQGYVNIIRETYINIGRINEIKVILNYTLRLIQACKYNLHSIS